MPPSVAERDRLEEVLRGRIAAAGEQPGAVIDPAALADVNALVVSAPDIASDLTALQLIGWLYWARYEAGGRSEETERIMALTFLHPPFAADPASVPPDALPALSAMPQGDGRLWVYLGALSLQDAVAMRSQDQLEGAILLLQRALAELAAGQPGAPETWANLAQALAHRYELDHELTDLDDALDAERHAVELAGTHEPWVSQFAAYLARLELRRRDAVSRKEWLDRAILDGEQRLDGLAAGDPSRVDAAASLASLHGKRFGTSGEVADLDRAESLAGEALGQLASGDARYGPFCGLRANALGSRFAQRGDPGDLEQAMHWAISSYDATPREDPYRLSAIHTLGQTLLLRYGRDGGRDDLNRAIELLGEAAELTGAGARYAAVGASLAQALCERFAVDHDPADAGLAVDWARAAVGALPEGHRDRAACLSALGRALVEQHHAGGDPSVLDQAIGAFTDAAAARRPGDPQQAGDQANLGVTLLERFALSGEVQSLDEAVRAEESALEATPEGSPGHAERLYNLGAALQGRFEASGDAPSGAQAVDLLRRAAASSLAPTSVRIAAAGRAGSLAASLGDMSGASGDFAAAVALLPLLASRRLPRSDAERWLAQYAGLAAAAAGAAVAVGDPEQALALLEQGRGILLARDLDIGDDALARADPETASRLQALRDEMEGASLGAELPGVDPAERRRAAAAGFDELVAQVRRRAGFEHYLDSPSFAELAAASRQGAVVVLNTSPWGCQALVLRDDALSVVPLPGLTWDQAVEHAGDFLAAISLVASPDTPPRQRRDAELRIGSDLEWVWEVVGAPVLDALGHRQRPAPGREWPRVWWVAGGPMSVFPIGAAGRSVAPVAAAAPVPDTSARSGPLPDTTAGGAPAAPDTTAGSAPVAPDTTAGTAPAAPDTTAGSAPAAPDTTAGTALAVPDTPTGTAPAAPDTPTGTAPVAPGTLADDRDAAVAARVISSYAPTVTSLVRVRQAAAAAARSQQGEPPSSQLLAVAMTHTPGAVDLPGTEREAEMLTRRFPGATVLRDGEAVRSRVLAELPAARWAHFACHAVNDPGQPSQSALWLYDHDTAPLDVLELARLRLEGGQFAYLSACSTTVTAPRLADEAVHITGGCLLAGFSRVVGTLWTVDDDVSADIAEQVYAALGADEDVAVALHAALASVRERYPRTPSLWAAHVHVGA